jgi:hypothetical protein
MIRPAERFPVNVAEAEPAAANSPAVKPKKAWEPVVLAVAVAVGAAAGWLLPTGGWSPGSDATALAVGPATPAPAGVEPAAGPSPR